jgi:hypothetical protein
MQGVAAARTFMHACAGLVDDLRAALQAAGQFLRVLHPGVSCPNHHRNNALATQPPGVTERSRVGADVPRLVGRQGDPVPGLLPIGPVTCRGPPGYSAVLQ